MTVHLMTLRCKWLAFSLSCSYNMAMAWGGNTRLGVRVVVCDITFWFVCMREESVYLIILMSHPSSLNKGDRLIGAHVRASSFG
jgi:hypothetical protein